MLTLPWFLERTSHLECVTERTELGARTIRLRMSLWAKSIMKPKCWRLVLLGLKQMLSADGCSGPVPGVCFSHHGRILLIQDPKVYLGALEISKQPVSMAATGCFFFYSLTSAFLKHLHFSFCSHANESTG